MSKPEGYTFQWADPHTVTAEDHMTAKRWAANMRMAPGHVRGIVERVEELVPQVATLSDKDKAERIAKAQQFVGGEKAHEEIRSRLSLSCDGCMRWRQVDPQDFAAQHGLAMNTPLLTIARALRCERCGARKGRAGPAPHDIYDRDRLD